MSEQGDFTIRVPKRALKILGILGLAVALVGAGVGAGIAANGGGDSSASATAASDRRKTTGRPAATTTTTVAPVDVATEPARGSGSPGNGGGATNGGGEAAGQDAAPPPPPPPAASLAFSVTPLPANCGTAIPTLSVRWDTVGATTMEIALGGGAFGPAPLGGSRLYPLPCVGGVSVCGRATNAVGAVTLRCANAAF